MTELDAQLATLAQLITLVAFAIAALGFVLAGWSAWRGSRR